MPASTTRCCGGGGSASIRCSSMAVSSSMVITVPPGIDPPVSALLTNWPSGSTTEPNSESRNPHPPHNRSEEHTSELQSRLHLVCRLLLEKKKTIKHI